MEITQGVRFDSLGLSEEIMRALEKKKPKAKVFPVPVGALAVTSCQSSIGGMHPA